MNYSKIYQALIEHAKQLNKLSSYTETHHIIPKCIGGTDDKSNLVELTAKEHFIAHLLLAKIHGGKLIHAAHMMSNMGRYTSKKYEWLREEHSKRMSNVLTGVQRTLTQKENNSKAQLKKNEERRLKGKCHPLVGKKKDDSHKSSWYESRKKGKGWVNSDLQREVTSQRVKGEGNPMYGKDHSPEAKVKISKANKQKVECPFCKKIGGKAIMKRWHFHNCKQNPSILVRSK